MNAIDTINVGESLPRIASVSSPYRWVVSVTWADGKRQHVNLAPAIFAYKFYRPLRDDWGLFKSTHIVNDGSAIAWGEDDAIDMDASTVARLAERDV